MQPVPNVCRVQAIFQNITGLNRDRVINTFHFINGAASPVDVNMRTACANRVIDFYNGVTGANPALATWLSPVIDRQPGKGIMRTYDLGEIEPRVPVDYTYQVGAGSTVVPMPNEVAICLSYYGNANIPSLRGRIYFGPLTTGALAAESSQPDVSNAVRTSLLEAADRLAGSNAEIYPWVMLSKAKEQRTTKAGNILPAEPVALVTIKNAWVDDEWDTQRRRGLTARSRVSRVLFT